MLKPITDFDPSDYNSIFEANPDIIEQISDLESEYFWDTIESLLEEKADSLSSEGIDVSVHNIDKVSIDSSSQGLYFSKNVAYNKSFIQVQLHKKYDGLEADSFFTCGAYFDGTDTDLQEIEENFQGADGEDWYDNHESAGWEGERKAAYERDFELALQKAKELYDFFWYAVKNNQDAPSDDAVIDELEAQGYRVDDETFELKKINPNIDIEEYGQQVLPFKENE